MKKVLIIKLGLSETLEGWINETVCYGDVLRATVILNFFKNHHITWLVEKPAVPLLDGNKYVEKILINNSSSRQKILKGKFDIVINLEKIPEICKLGDTIDCDEKFGFGLNKKGEIKPYKGAEEALGIGSNLEKKRRSKLTYQEHLANITNKKWNGEEYILGYKPRNKMEFDIGFNWKAAKQWKNKAWPLKYWKELEKMIKDKYSISWQKGLRDIYRYIEWINSCRLVLTNDSLGMHIALALKKRVVALCGPTSKDEIYLYNSGAFILPGVKYKCMPCFRKICSNDRFCLEDICPEKVMGKINSEFGRLG